MDIAGISYYTSAPSARLDKIVMYKQIVTAINQKVKISVFIAGFSYPSGDVLGPFSSWTKDVAGYHHKEDGQSAFYQDIVHRGKEIALLVFVIGHQIILGGTACLFLIMMGKRQPPKRFYWTVCQSNDGCLRIQPCIAFIQHHMDDV
ncbi:hypothetical protein [Enterococcus casseliflavus]|uniref:hypothetical protein n=1 Tax=Enterococcus casseliflavus TaxID=37734 RepID=UPI0014332ACE|nr:hypothetical protein [Enterococcus casseliflavus]NKD34144.1 hypothetical protein [Enterococcus casseliflavus]